MTRLAPRWAAPASLIAVLAAATSLDAQSVRIRSTTTARYVQLQPIRYNQDSARFEALPVSSATPLVQDVEVVAWGFGMSGLRAYGLLRARGTLGSDLVWPRADDYFDALAAYLELERPHYRLRLGRQQRPSALGWYGFDGLMAAWLPQARIRLEGYAGRGVARGFLEPVGSEALKSIDALQPEKGTYLLGASVWTAPTRTSSVSAIYQREILTDRSGLVSERAAVDAHIGIGSRLLLSGSSDFDLAMEEWGKARFAALWQIGRRAAAEVEVFRYRPTLDLTTIWGVFTPESHWGYGATARYAPSRDVAAWTSYSRRQYKATAPNTPFLPDLSDAASEIAAGAHIRRGDYVFDGTYRLQIDFGGSQSGGDVSLASAPLYGWRLGVRGSAFQRDGQFRVSDGKVYGLGVQARGRLAERFDIRADLMRFWHKRQEGQVALDWSQTRALIAVDWTFGSNPDRQGAYR